MPPTGGIFYRGGLVPEWTGSFLFTGPAAGTCTTWCLTRMIPNPSWLTRFTCKTPADRRKRRRRADLRDRQQLRQPGRVPLPRATCSCTSAPPDRDLPIAAFAKLPQNTPKPKKPDSRVTVRRQGHQSVQAEHESSRISVTDGEEGRVGQPQVTQSSSQSGKRYRFPVLWHQLRNKSWSRCWQWGFSK